MHVVPLMLAFLAIVALMGADLAEDWQSGQTAHLVLEGLVTGIAVLGAGWLVWVLLNQRRDARLALQAARVEAEQVRADNEALAAEAARWREEAEAALRGLGEAIDRQFERWGLTPAESEVALLLLKGLSTKEIASVRDTTDRTVRQQARAIYAKGSLAGRAELAAFFLEDLMLPAGADSSARPPLVGG